MQRRTWKVEEKLAVVLEMFKGVRCTPWFGQF